MSYFLKIIVFVCDCMVNETDNKRIFNTFLFYFEIYVCYIRLWLFMFLEVCYRKFFEYSVRSQTISYQLICFNFVVIMLL